MAQEMQKSPPTMSSIVWQPERPTTKLAILAGISAVTLGVHYGWLVEPFFGHVHWLHVVHGRFCYIPIVVGAAWFGLRGGLLTALAISILVLPYIFGSDLASGSLAVEFAEIIFYFALALIVGGLLDRELRLRRRAEEMRLQLERSQKMSLVGQIAAGMAHEIKNPLASIKGAVEIISDDSSEKDERDEFQGIVLKEIKRIDSSLTDFLAFARPGETRLSRLDLSQTVQAGLKQVQTQARKAGVEFDSHIEEGVIIDGDSEKIHQVLLNLLLNAIDASSDGDRVMISLQRDDDSNNVTLRVADFGAGVSEADSEKVFEPFFTTKPSGTGLGLAIARTIIENHNGHIRLVNRPEGGALAEVSLPAAKAVAVS